MCAADRLAVTSVDEVNYPALLKFLRPRDPGPDQNHYTNQEPVQTREMR